MSRLHPPPQPPPRPDRRRWLAAAVVWTAVLLSLLIPVLSGPQPARYAAACPQRP